MQIVDAREMLRLETRREIGRVEVRRLERALSRRRLLGPKGLDEESFLTEARVLRAEPWLEGEKRARRPHGELGWHTARQRRMTLGDDRVEANDLAMGELRGVRGRARSFHHDVVEADDVLEALRRAGDNQTEDTEPGEHGQGRAAPSSERESMRAHRGVSFHTRPQSSFPPRERRRGLVIVHCP